MARPATKLDFISVTNKNYEKLLLLMSQLTEEELSTTFNFSNDEKKKEAHWKRDKNLRDVLIHLYEWQQLLLSWVHANQNGEKNLFFLNHIIGKHMER